MPKYVLRYFRDVNRKRSYFEEMTNIGPAFTPNLSKAMTFHDEQAAQTMSLMRPFGIVPVVVERIADAPDSEE